MSKESAYWKKSGLRAHLKQLRKEFDYTIEYVATESGYDKGYLLACENGYRAPSVDCLVNWCIVFNHRLCLMDFTERANHKAHVCPDLESHVEGDGIGGTDGVTT